jgi:glycosyltransferase involved in cell wall biosynthesis
MIENSLFEPIARQRAKRTAENDRSGNHRAVDADIDKRSHAADAGPATIAYGGTLEAYQGIGLLLRAFAALTSHCPDADLLIVGGSAAQVHHYQIRANQYQIGEKVRFTGRLPRQQAQRHLAQARVLVSPRTRGNNTPLKIYELLASGQPLVATNVRSHTQVLTNDMCFLAEPEPTALATALRSALTDRAEAHRRAQAAKATYDTHYNRAAYEDKIATLLQMVQ